MMYDLLARIALAMLIPAMVLSWRHSKLVSAAIAVPLFANLYVVATGAVLSVEHPARVLIPAVSAALGFAEAYATGWNGKEISRPCLLGILTFAIGGADIAALPTFAVLHGWSVPWLSIIVCLAIIAVATTPKGKISWLISSI